MAEFNGQQAYTPNQAVEGRYSAELQQRNGAWLFLGDFESIAVALDAVKTWQEVKPIYVLGNGGRTLHIIPGMTFTPALCGFKPTARFNGKSTWKVYERDFKFVTRQISICTKCEELAGVNHG